MKNNKKWLKQKFKAMAGKLKSIWQKPEHVFLSLAIPFGVIMTITMQLFMAPDEGVHFFRAYQIGQGQLISQTQNNETGGYIPKKIIEYFEHHFSTDVRFGGDPPLSRWQYFTDKTEGNEVFMRFPSSALYSPVGYIPQATGIAVGEALYPSFGVMVLLGRLFNLAAYIFLIYLAIRIARHGKWVYTVVGLFPMAIHQAASLSSDVMTTGCALVFIALLHRSFMQETPLERWQYILFFMLALGIALTKQTNIVLLLPILFLPKRLFASGWKKIGFILAVAGAAILAAGAWYAVLKFGNYNLQISGEPGVNQAAQIHYLLEHPLQFIKILFQTYVYEGFRGLISTDFYLTSAYGVFSFIAYKLPLSLIFVGYITLFLAFLHKDKDETLQPKEYKKMGILAIIQSTTFIVSLAAIAAALYLTWTPVGQPQAWGIQGRYFIALIPLLIPLSIILGRWIRITFDKPYRLGMIISVVSFVNLSVMAIMTFKWFYA